MKVKAVSGVMLILLLVGMLTLAFDVKPASAEVLFSDDFEGTSLDTTKWNRTGGGSVAVADSYVTLSSSGEFFAHLCTKTNPFPTIGDFVLEFDLTYLQVTEYLTGFWVTQGWDTNYSPPRPLNHIFFMWQDSLEYLNIYLLGNSSSSDSVDTTRHVYVLEYSNGTYTLYMGGEEIASASSSLRPDAIRIGELNGHPLPPDVWTSFKIDEITLTTLTEVSTGVTVGGIYIPTNKFSLLAPYIGLTLLFAVATATVVYVKKRKKQ